MVIHGYTTLMKSIKDYTSLLLHCNNTKIYNIVIILLRKYNTRGITEMGVSKKKGKIKIA